ncbi:MAG: hypothetical protein KGH60_03880 [Candidatus Micrarchaeota archaeon]|nr:hypothetical protein [Candidatus Micrarchaeota archaeon]
MTKGQKDKQKRHVTNPDEADQKIVKELHKSAAELSSHGGHSVAAALLLTSTRIEGGNLKIKLRGSGINPDGKTGCEITDKLLTDLDSLAVKNAKEGNGGMAAALMFVTDSIRNDSMRRKLDAIEAKESAG